MRRARVSVGPPATGVVPASMKISLRLVTVRLSTRVVLRLYEAGRLTSLDGAVIATIMEGSCFHAILPGGPLLLHRGLSIFLVSEPPDSVLAYCPLPPRATSIFHSDRSLYRVSVAILKAWREEHSGKWSSWQCLEEAARHTARCNSNSPLMELKNPRSENSF